DFDGREKDLNATAEAHAKVVDPCNHNEPEHRERLRPSELKIVGRNPVGKAGNRDVHGKKGNSERGAEATQEAHHTCGDRSGRARTAHDRMHPAEEKSPNRAEAAAKVCILTACFGNGRSELSIRERAKDGEDRASDPRGKNDGNEATFARHLGGLK